MTAQLALDLPVERWCVEAIVDYFEHDDDDWNRLLRGELPTSLGCGSCGTQDDVWISTYRGAGSSLAKTCEIVRDYFGERGAQRVVHLAWEQVAQVIQNADRDGIVPVGYGHDHGFDKVERIGYAWRKRAAD